MIQKAFKTTLTIFLTLMALITFSQTEKVVRGPKFNLFDIVFTKPKGILKRIELKKEIDFFSGKLDLLDCYYKQLNAKNIDSADKILSTDTTFSHSGAEDFSIAYMYILAKMRQFGLLYKPCIYLNDSSVELIVCTKKQRDVLIKNNKKEYELHCKYIGSIIIGKKEVYQLIS